MHGIRQSAPAQITLPYAAARYLPVLSVLLEQRKHFRVRNASSHPLCVPETESSPGAQSVRMIDQTVAHYCDRFKPSVWVPRKSGHLAPRVQLGVQQRF